MLELLVANLPTGQADAVGKAKDILDEVSAMKKHPIASVKMAVSILTAIQAIFRALKPGENRQELAAKYAKLRAKRALPLSPKLSLLLSQLGRQSTIAAKATTA